MNLFMAEGGSGSETEEHAASSQPVQGSFLNLLPPQLEISQKQKGSI